MRLHLRFHLDVEDLNRFVRVAPQRQYLRNVCLPTCLLPNLSYDRVSCYRLPHRVLWVCHVNDCYVLRVPYLLADTDVPVALHGEGSEADVGVDPQTRETDKLLELDGQIRASHS